MSNGTRGVRALERPAVGRIDDWVSLARTIPPVVDLARNLRADRLSTVHSWAMGARPGTIA